MSQGKVRTGHLELVICLAVPLVVIFIMVLLGFLYERNQTRLLAQRDRLMTLIPILEQNAVAAHQALKPFVSLEGAKDMAADLSLVVSDAAQKFGFAIRSSNVEKQVGAGNGSWTDYKLTLSGDGALTSLIALLDHMGQPQRHFCVAQVSLKATRLSPEMTCSADLILVSRVMTDQNYDFGLGPLRTINPAVAEELGAKVGRKSELVKAWATDTAIPLSLKQLQDRMAYEPTVTSQAQIEPLVSFRLTGIVREKNFPMIMTDQGVFGVGDEVDGFVIESIGEDKVSLVSKGGRHETVKLYKGGGGM